MLNKLLDRLEEWIIAALIGAATVLVFVSVVHRYGTSASADVARWAQVRELATWYAVSNGIFSYLQAIDMGWVKELATIMFVWMAKFGAAFGVRQGIHVGVDVLTNRLTPRTRAPVVMLALFCGALFTAVVGTLGVVFVEHIRVDGQTTEVLEWPSWLVYLAIPLGSFLMCFRFLQVMWGFYRTGEVPHHGHTTVEVPGIIVPRVDVTSMQVPR